MVWIDWNYKELCECTSPSPIFPLNKVIDTAARRQSKLIWQGSGRNNLLYRNNSLFILESKTAQRKRGEKHPMTIFHSEMKLIAVGAEHSGGHYGHKQSDFPRDA